MSLPENANLLDVCTPAELNQGMKACQAGSGEVHAWLLGALEAGTIEGDRLALVAEAGLQAYYESIRLGYEAEQIVASVKGREYRNYALRKAGTLALAAGRTLVKSMANGLRYSGWGIIIPSHISSNKSE